MIDTVYQTLTTIINKEIQGYVSPTEYNLIANNVQLEIFREYFEDENRDKNRENRGLSNKGYSNLDFNQRQRIDQFAESSALTRDNAGFYPLPPDLYFLEDDGLYYKEELQNLPRVIEEVERAELAYLLNSMAKPTLVYPVYERFSNIVKVYPETVPDEVYLRYLRTPKIPKWTFFTLPDGNPAYNPTATDFQDFELHESEFSNIVVRMLLYFGINLREADVAQIAQTLKDKNNLKDNA
jgi:hypothetical protein